MASAPRLLDNARIEGGERMSKGLLVAVLTLAGAVVSGQTPRNVLWR